MDSATLISMLVFAATAAASPFSLLAFGLVLATDRGTRNGIAFILGWIMTVVLIGVATAIVGDAYTVNRSNTPGAWTLAVELALGLILLAAWLRRRFRPNSTREVVDAAPEPAWQRRIQTMGYAGSFVLGGALQTWPVMIAGATEVLRADLGPARTVVWMLVFALATTTGIVILEVLAARSPGSAVTRLNRMQSFIETHRDTVVNWVYLVGGLWLIFRGLIGLTTR